MIGKKKSLLLAAVVTLALGLYGCGGGDSGPQTGGGQPKPEGVDLSSVTAGFMAAAGTVRVAAGQSVVHGDIEFSCAAGGADCEVMVTVDANDDISATSTGGMVTSMNSAAYTARITPMSVDLAPVTAGFMAVAGTVQVAAGQSVVHGDIEFSCAAGGADCEVMVTVDANGGITATSTGGMVTAMNSDAYTARITPMAVDFASVTAGFMAGAGIVQVAAGQSAVHGDIAFSCAAGGADCEVMVTVDTNGGITATSTGGMVTAMNSDAFTARITPMTVDLAPLTAGFAAGAGTVQVAAGQSAVHGDIAFSCAAGGPDCEVMVTVDANGGITATSTGGAVTAMNSDAYTARIPPMAVDFASVTAGFAAGAGIVQVAAGQSAVHGDIAFSCAAGGADCEVVVTVDANGGITATSTGGAVTAMNSAAYTARITPVEPAPVREGGIAEAAVSLPVAGSVTQSSDSYQGVTANTVQASVSLDSKGELVADVRGADWRIPNVRSFLRLRDVVAGWSDWSLGDSFQVESNDSQRMAFLLTDRKLPPEQNVRVGDVWASSVRYDTENDFLNDADEGISGTLNGEYGTLRCCSGVYSLEDPGVVVPGEDSTNHIGSAQPYTMSQNDANQGYAFIRQSDAQNPPQDADHLILGFWDYVPAKWISEHGERLYWGEDGFSGQYYTDTEFGVFVDGSDPFEQNNIRTLTGTATYTGPALGKYIDTNVEPSTGVGKESLLLADAILTADFGGVRGNGEVSGSIGNFWNPDYSPHYVDHSALSTLPATLTLNTAAIGDGHSGFFSGDTAMTFDGSSFAGKWGGQFYGNSETDGKPGSAAGTFGAATSDGSRAIIGAFGTYKLADAPDEVADAGAARAIGKVLAPNNLAYSESNISAVVHSSVGSGSGYFGLAQAYSEYGGRYAYGMPWRDNGDDLQYHISMTSIAPKRDDRIAYQGRSIITSEETTLLGARTSVVEDEAHSLGQPWRVFEAIKEWDGGGTLTANVATDANDTDILGRPWVGYGDIDRTITLDDIPGLRTGHDWQGLGIPEDGLSGSLDGVAGVFSCQANYCNLETPSRLTEAYYVTSGPIEFRPLDGSDSVILPSNATSKRVPTAEYLSFGSWFYVPDNPAHISAYDFGVFAGGGDPYDTVNLERLEGSATYTGKATGMYYAAGSSSGLEVGDFRSEVELTADFGTASDDSTLTGRIHNLVYDGAVTALPTELWLTQHERWWVTTSGSGSEGAYFRGIVDGDSMPEDWHGEWSAAFFGNGVTTSEHPTSVAGTFGAASANSGLVGAFGAHRQ